MRCETCQGKGFRPGPRAVDPKDPSTDAVLWYPCLECQGTGIVSCCEGSERGGQLPNEVSDNGTS